MYRRALLGGNTDAAVKLFLDKLAAYDPNKIGSYPAQVVVGLLARLERYRDAIDVSRRFLADTDPAQLTCPTVLQLCQLAGDYEELRKTAIERGDLLSYIAAAVQTKSTVKTG